MPESTAITVQTNVAVPMRDGVTLYADIYRPEGAGPFPVLLQRTPYDKGNPLSMTSLDPMKSARNGYAVMIQDTRGRYNSEGEFYCFRDEINDGYDTVEWAAAQSWSTGKVGMYGASYVGATQWLAALSKPPHLAAIIPNVTASNYHEGWTYQGGAFELGFNVSWTMLQLTLANLQNISSNNPAAADKRGRLVQAADGMEEAFRSHPLKEFPHLKDGLADYFYDWLAHPEYDDYWKKLCIEDHHPQINVPRVEYRWLVRHIPRRHHSQLPGYAEEWKRGRREAGTKAAHWPVAAQRPRRQRGGRPLLRSCRRRHGHRHGPYALAVVRPLVERRR